MKKIIVPGSFSSLETIRQFYTTAAQQAGLTEDDIFELQVAVDEATANIIDHAYGGENKGDIECCYEITPEGLKVELRDHGIPFKPKQVKAPDILRNPSARKEGGLGMFFIHQMMDEVCFCSPDDGGNLLSMIKRKETTD